MCKPAADRWTGAGSAVYPFGSSVQMRLNLLLSRSIAASLIPLRPHPLRATPPLPQYKPHNQTQHSDKGHKSAHHGHAHAHSHGHKSGKPHHGGKAAVNGGVAHKAGKPAAAAHVHVQTEAPAAAANGEPAAAASS